MMYQRLAAVIVVAAAAASGARPAAATSPLPGVRSIVVVGVPALRWQDVTPAGTPALWQLASEGAVGSLSVRATADLPHAETAPADGWATISAGNRAAGRPAADSDPLDVPVLPAATAALAKRNAGLEFDAHIGALGDSLRRASIRRVAIGAGAALALADSTGAVDATYPLTSPSEVATHVGEAVARQAVVFVEAPQLLTATSSTALSEVDALVAAIADVIDPNDLLIVAGISDRPGEPSRLHVAIARGPRYPPGRLQSALTRRPGFVQLIDLAPTVLQLRYVRPNEAMVGRPWVRVSRGGGTDAAVVARLVDADTAAAGYRRYVPPFFFLLVLAQILLYAGAFVALRRHVTPRGRILSVTRGVALAFAGVPAATYLAHLTPWWRHPIWFLVAVVALIDAVLLAVATLGPWRARALGPEGFVAGTTFAVIGVDLLTGARLQMSSLAGYSPVVAGRFAGIGNVAFAVFATGALLFATALCVGVTRRRAVLTVAAVGIVAIVIDGNPLWGSDFGGVLALVPGFAVLAVLVSGRRVSRGVVAAIAIGAVTVVAAFALADYARPAASQTHLGRFVGELLHGGAGTIVARKARANVRLLKRSVLTLVVPVAVVFVTVVLLRPAGGLRRALHALPVLRSGLISVLVMSVAGFVFNDSGVAIPALALSVAVPLALATAMRYADPTTSAPPGESARPDLN